MTAPLNQPDEQDDLSPNDGIALEPTRMDEADTSVHKSFFDTIAAGIRPTASMMSDTQQLLRSRLLIVALIAGTFSAIQYALSIFVPDTGEGRMGASLAARSFFSFTVAALLGSRAHYSLKQLRLFEYLFFGVWTAIVLVSQFLISSELILSGDEIGVIAFDKNGVLRMTVLMIVYGVLIPNDPKVAARMILTMAAGPIVVLALLHEVHADATTIINHMASSEIVVMNAVHVVMGAAIAIFATYMVNGLRTELHDARRLGQYELGDKLGSGGMGEVYMAEHQLLKRPCALKLINADLESNPLALARFKREVESAAMLAHPNTIEIYDYGQTADGTFYYVMQYLPGLSLADLVQQFGALPPGRVVYIIRQVCKSLAEAHHLGMVHRDLKPANIIVAILGGECDFAKVLDFGLVKVTADPTAPQLTADYTVSGTPSYMSPEQATGSRDLDGRTDIYALGAILYYLLTGKPPFEKENPVALMVAHASEPVTPPSQLGIEVPADLEAVVLRCLAKDSGDRYPDARTLGAALAMCKCATEWDGARAEQWWLERAEPQVSADTENTAAATIGL